MIEKYNRLVLAVFLLGLLSLLLSFGFYQSSRVLFVNHLLEYAIFLLFMTELAYQFYLAPDRKRFLKLYIVELAILGFILTIFAGKQYSLTGFESYPLKTLTAVIIFIRNSGILLRLLVKIEKFNYFIKKLFSQPALTITLSFALVIGVGALLLYLPFAATSGSRVSLIDALFTATSAVCVTGLTTLDTATIYSRWGQLVIMLLIQVGGLGIMVFSSALAFFVGKRISRQDQLTISYMLNENDIASLTRGLRNIIFIVLVVETVGALLLFISFYQSTNSFTQNVFFAVFHSVSAFCNAGFALFSTNLEQFKSQPLLNFTIAGLIIMGGLSFVVITDTFRALVSRVKVRVFRVIQIPHKLALNTKVVLIATTVLLVGGTLVIYQLEHRAAFLAFDLPTQYLAAFFQTVTARTAGFNTIDMVHLNNATYFFIIILMFIGAASGSTAGGIKVNSLGVLAAYLKSVLAGRKDEVVLMKQSLPMHLVSQTFFVILVSLTVVCASTLLLCMTEYSQTFIRLLFEVVSAFGTVGLSAGVTPALSPLGKIIIIGTMFFGRIGPLTIITAMAQQGRSRLIKYPAGDIRLG